MMSKHRLAVVSRKKEVTFITKPSNSTGNANASHNTVGSTDENLSSGDAWLWDCFAKRYKPNCVEQPDCYRSYTSRYAWLGIQRSTADVISECQNTFHSLK
ncbi:hypothetical protein EON65_32045 [archaeon]|nr:MAG: hypothetical protein EON65_32045 [archaeon]